MNILKQPAADQKLSVVAVDLIECLLDGNSAAFQFDMHGRQSIDKHSHIIAIRANALGFVLIDNLQVVIVNVGFINQDDVFSLAVIPFQQPHVIFLDFGSFLFWGLRQYWRDYL